MTGETAAATPGLVSGRACGSCNVCCVVLTIDDPAMQKPQGYRCRHALRDNSCAIYDDRPNTCRTFHCGWRLLKWVRESLRPDKSGVLIRLHYDKPGADRQRALGIIVTLLNRAALKTDGLAETVATAVAAGLPIYLEIPGPPGHTGGRARINDVLSEAVITKDKAAVLNVLRRSYARGQHGDHKVITFTHRP